ncbi:5'-3' exoribonuclease 2 [Trichonephila inaurata madagascariensis]|uniref:5'-3' exoribonuclease n=1 Tax=Trichonephila inaurata madagascariensis TaxID=2747483 RepID=A0A8X6Y567_9ARAC|nr:5'-3' exoribonuclease 2 [Trichonephila inaurata madagascariensis]
MGVPAFFRWLSRKYPSIVVHCIEDKAKIVNGEKIPVDTSQKNPNDVEFDNLYLDMNGIIHPCCHPENKPAPKDEEEMMVAIFEYIDRIFSIVRPRRLLYMAIDGVAPRAKMNQQRSRRFRASKETVEKVDLISTIREKLLMKGINVPPEKPKEEHFDSNCITPGTPFMDRLAKCLHYYIHDRLNSDPGWRNIEVILSDANVPGEGEHKIMDFIRRQRSNPEHDANTRHCLCGADADLIMLGLATHEPNFTIIREEFKPNQPRPCELCGQIGHDLKGCTGAAKEMQGEFDELTKPIEIDVEFIFIRLNVLREYLAKELTMDNLPFPYDLERVIDDWVFMCFFVGNDFLPHLPSLEIREGAIDRLVELYKNAVRRTGGFVTNSGHVDLSRVQLIMTNLGEVEDEIFKKRQESELAFQARMKYRNKRMKMNQDNRPAWTPGGQFGPRSLSQSPSPVQNPRQEAYQMRMSSSSSNASQGSAKQRLESMMVPENNSDNSSEVLGMKRKREESESEEEPEDDVKLWEDGWKSRYYEVKFKVDADDVEFRHKVAAAYVEGLCWVLRYYYQGCASWNWYFPYHYAPFASDFVNIGDIKINFDLGKPFNPLEQLMAVFPAASKQHVPTPWGDLMSDPDSPIIDFYPTDFKVDLNGKKYAWQGVALLPFVDERRLLKALESVYDKLTKEEKRRNIRGKDKLYIRGGHAGYEFLVALYEAGSNWKLEIDMNPKLFSGMGGTVILSKDVIHPKETVKSPLNALPDIPGNATVCVSFIDPRYPEDFIFPAERLKSAVDPPKVLKPGQTHVTDRNNFRGRPQVGMAPYNKRVSLNAAGHRMLNHNMRDDKNSVYGNVPPPNAYADRNRYGYHRNRGPSRGPSNQHQSYARGQGGGSSHSNQDIHNLINRGVMPGIQLLVLKLAQWWKRRWSRWKFFYKTKYTGILLKESIHVLSIQMFAP